MDVVRVFPRLPEDADADAWGTRMDALLASHPVELLQFVQDALISLAARADEDHRDLDSMFDIVCAGADVESALAIARRRWEAIVAVMTEHTPLDEAGVREALEVVARSAPWMDS